MTKKPIISKEVIDYLGNIFPDKCPDINMTEKEVREKEVIENEVVV